MNSALVTLAYGLPISAVIIALIVDNIFANKITAQIKMARIEAEKQIKIAQAQSAASPSPTPPSDHGAAAPRDGGTEG